MVQKVLLPGFRPRNYDFFVEVKKKDLLFLFLVNLVYAGTSIFTKLASMEIPWSISYDIWLLCAVGVIGLYALLWQRIIARMDISTAYMFKGLSLVFVLLFSFFLFGELITVNNLLGSTLIITGIVLFSKA